MIYPCEILEGLIPSLDTKMILCSNNKRGGMCGLNALRRSDDVGCGREIVYMPEVHVCSAYYRDLYGPQWEESWISIRKEKLDVF